MSKLNLGVMISGNGSNLQAIIDAIENQTLNANINLVISNKSKAKGLERAKKHGLNTKVISHSEYPSRNEFDEALVFNLKKANVDYVVLAGFMRILTPTFLNAFHMKVINIHPSLLPSFKGTNAQKQALDYGVRITGCTVHFVDSGIDTGPIIMQIPVIILTSDTLESLTNRILKAEHKLLPKVLQMISDNKFIVEEKKPHIKWLK